jgi:hypothetical protein
LINKNKKMSEVKNDFIENYGQKDWDDVKIYSDRVDVYNKDKDNSDFGDADLYNTDLAQLNRDFSKFKNTFNEQLKNTDKDEKIQKKVDELMKNTFSFNEDFFVLWKLISWLKEDLSAKIEIKTNVKVVDGKSVENLSKDEKHSKELVEAMTKDVKNNKELDKKIEDSIVWGLLIDYFWNIESIKWLLKVQWLWNILKSLMQLWENDKYLSSVDALLNDDDKVKQWKVPKDFLTKWIWEFDSDLIWKLKNILKLKIWKFEFKKNIEDLWKYSDWIEKFPIGVEWWEKSKIIDIKAEAKTVWNAISIRNQMNDENKVWKIFDLDWKKIIWDAVKTKSFNWVVEKFTKWINLKELENFAKNNEVIRVADIDPNKPKELIVRFIKTADLVKDIKEKKEKDKK